jgi:hypothetical protein
LASRSNTLLPRINETSENWIMKTCYELFSYLNRLVLC